MKQKQSGLQLCMDQCVLLSYINTSICDGLLFKRESDCLVA